MRKKQDEKRLITVFYLFFSIFGSPCLENPIDLTMNLFPELISKIEKEKQ